MRLCVHARVRLACLSACGESISTRHTEKELRKKRKHIEEASLSLSPRLWLLTRPIALHLCPGRTAIIAALLRTLAV